MKNLFFAPKGGMCKVCIHALDTEFCKKLDFAVMPKISEPFLVKGENTITVKCSEFERKIPESYARKIADIVNNETSKKFPIEMYRNQLNLICNKINEYTDDIIRLEERRNDAANLRYELEEKISRAESLGLTEIEDDF